MSQSLIQKAQYLKWAGTKALGAADQVCPGCQSPATVLVRRKYLVTSLWECNACGLNFRMPKDDPAASRAFYQREYSQGFTTDCPSGDALKAMLATNFAGSGRNYEPYIQVLAALGLAKGDSILDFGASWGYGSWQLRRAGFNVTSYEISKPRAEYARTKLGCSLIENLDELPGKVKCFFSSHVIEHLPNPSLIWELGQKVLSDDGFIVCFCPNGDPASESAWGPGGYDRIWGKVHPMLITSRYFQSMSARHGFRASIFSSPYRLDAVAGGAPGDNPPGIELCLVARRAQ